MEDDKKSERSRWQDGAHERISPLIAEITKIVNGHPFHDIDVALWYVLAETYKMGIHQGADANNVVFRMMLPGFMTLIKTVAEFDKDLADKLEKMREELK